MWLCRCLGKRLLLGLALKGPTSQCLELPLGFMFVLIIDSCASVSLHSLKLSFEPVIDTVCYFAVTHTAVRSVYTHSSFIRLALSMLSSMLCPKSKSFCGYFKCVTDYAGPCYQLMSCVTILGLHTGKASDRGLCSTRKLKLSLMLITSCIPIISNTRFLSWSGCVLAEKLSRNSLQCSLIFSSSLVSNGIHSCSLQLQSSRCYTVEICNS